MKVNPGKFHLLNDESSKKEINISCIYTETGFFVMRLNHQQQDSLKLYISLASCQEFLEIELTIECRFTLKRERDMIITYRRLNRLNNLVDSINMQKLF